MPLVRTTTYCFTRLWAFICCRNRGQEKLDHGDARTKTNKICEVSLVSTENTKQTKLKPYVVLLSSSQGVG